MAEVDKPYAGGRWTEAKYVQFVTRALRKAHLRWPVKQDALEAVRRPSKNTARSKCKWEYQCAGCTLWYYRDDVQVDHIEECSGILDDPGAFIARMFCEESGYQVLCGNCHAPKTQRARRRASK